MIQFFLWVQKKNCICSEWNWDVWILSGLMFNINKNFKKCEDKIWYGQMWWIELGRENQSNEKINYYCI